MEINSGTNWFNALMCKLGVHSWTRLDTDYWQEGNVWRGQCYSVCKHCEKRVKGNRTKIPSSFTS